MCVVFIDLKKVNRDKHRKKIICFEQTADSDTVSRQSLSLMSETPAPMTTNFYLSFQR